jgi:hypothetical protein
MAKKKCSVLDEFSLSKSDDGVSNEEKVISDDGSEKADDVSSDIDTEIAQSTGDTIATKVILRNVVMLEVARR